MAISHCEGALRPAKCSPALSGDLDATGAAPYRDRSEVDSQDCTKIQALLDAIWAVVVAVLIERKRLLDRNVRQYDRQHLPLCALSGFRAANGNRLLSSPFYLDAGRKFAQQPAQQLRKLKR